MLYIKLSCEVLTDAKILQVGPEAAFVWVRGLLYAKQHLTDGFVPHHALPLVTLGCVTDGDAISQQLIAAGLWQVVEEGWHVGAERWARHQVTREEVMLRTSQRVRGRSRYQDRLRDPRWQRLRLAIFQRDEWRCQECGAEDKTLHVHHTKYISGRDPWEYPADFLQTLCEDCHANASDDKFEEAVLRRLGCDAHNVSESKTERAPQS